MGFANEERIKKLLAELIPAGGGRLDVFGNTDETFIVADDVAMLRLGVGLARGVFLPRVSAYGRKTVDTKAFDVFDAYQHPVLFTTFEDSPEFERRHPRARREFGEIVALFFLAALLGLIGVGAVTVFRWLFG